MAAGDQAQASGYATVPEVGEEGRVRWGAREINKTRDYIALLKALIPTGKSSYRTEYARYIWRQSNVGSRHIQRWLQWRRRY
jgi:hypothetical protein